MQKKVAIKGFIAKMPLSIAIIILLFITLTSCNNRPDSVLIDHVPEVNTLYPRRSIYSLKNGDFEHRTMAAWSKNGIVRTTKEKSYYGSKSIKLTVEPDTDKDNTSIWQNLLIDTGTYDPKIGQGVEAGAWVYLTKDINLTGKDLYIAVYAVSTDKTKTLIAKSSPMTENTIKEEWTYLKSMPVNDGIIPNDSESIQVLVNNTIQSNVYVDLIQIGESGSINGNPIKMAFAAYQPWYGNPIDGDNHGWNNWAWSDSKITHDPVDILPNGNRDIASVLYPIIGAYSSTDEEVLRYHLELAKSAHIDGFFVNDYGKEINKDYRDCINKLFDLADEIGMKIALQYEPKIHLVGWVPTTASLDRIGKIRGIIDDIEYILEEFTHRKSYLKYNGLPIINPFGAGLLTDLEWKYIKDIVIKEGYGDFIIMSDIAPDSPYSYSSFSATYNWQMMCSETNPSNSPSYDMIHKWSIKSNKRSYNWVTGDLESRFGVGLAFPGFNDWGVGGDWGAGTARIAAYLVKDGVSNEWMGPADPQGDTLMATQNAVLESGVNWILYATFNDWNEATVIEPSQEFGHRFIVEVHNFLEGFKGLKNTNLDDDNLERITETYMRNRTVKYK